MGAAVGMRDGLRFEPAAWVNAHHNVGGHAGADFDGLGEYDFAVELGTKGIAEEMQDFAFAGLDAGQSGIPGDFGGGFASLAFGGATALAFGRRQCSFWGCFAAHDLFRL